MSYKPILVNIDINGPVVPILQAATGLARCHEAKLIGICSADAPMPMVGPEAAALAAETWQQMRNDIEKRFKEVHREYDRVIAGAIKTEWREPEKPYPCARPGIAVGRSHCYGGIRRSFDRRCLSCCRSRQCRVACRSPFAGRCRQGRTCAGEEDRRYLERHT